MEFNNCSNSTNISVSAKEYLQQLQDKTNITMIPAVTMLIIFAMVGLIGNSLVLVVYSQKFKLNSTKVIIMTIACFDLVANVGAIPIAMDTMFDTWDFTRPGVCKVTVFLGSFTAVGGGISLLTVAVVRYRKVCKPYGWQVTIRQAIIASTVAFILAFIVSIPYILMYGVRTRQTPCPKIQGSECFADDYYFYTIWPLLNNILFAVIYLILSATLVALYTLIGLTARKHRKLHGTSGDVPKVKRTDNSSPGVSSEDKEQVTLPEEPPVNQQAISSMLNQTTHVGQGRVQALLCWTRQQEGGTREDNTQSSVLVTTYTTTDADTEGNNTRTIENLVNTKTLASPTDVSIKTSRSTCFVDAGDFVRYDTKEEAKPFERTHTELSNEGRSALSDALRNKDDYVNPDQDNDLQRDQKMQNTSADNVAASKPQSPAKKKENSRPLGRMTAMLIIISAIFVFGYLPFLILTIFKNRAPEKYASMNMAEQTFYNFFYRLYFLNSAANPIIYSLCDANFRRQCLRFLTCKLHS